jgi:hypothetical protein
LLFGHLSFQLSATSLFFAEAGSEFLLRRRPRREFLGQPRCLLLGRIHLPLLSLDSLLFGGDDPGQIYELMFQLVRPFCPGGLELAERGDAGV